MNHQSYEFERELLKCIALMNYGDIRLLVSYTTNSSVLISLLNHLWTMVVLLYYV